MVVESWFLLLILGGIFTKGYCRELRQQKDFEKAVLKATCMLECNSGKPCVRGCTETPRQIKDLDEEAEAGVRLVCRDESYVVLAHNPGIYVIEQFEYGDDDVSRAALVSNGSKVKLTDLPTESPYHWLFYRVSAKGISSPERSANISKIPPSLTWYGAGAVTNVTTQLSWSETKDRPTSIYWESKIIFTPSQDRTCFYEVTCSQEDGNYHKTIELENTEEFSVTFKRLPSAANFTVNIRTPTDAQKWEKPGRRLGNITQTITNFSTPRCLDLPDYGNVCVPDAVTGLNASATHSSGNEFDVHVTWNPVKSDWRNNIYITYIINIDPSGAGTKNLITETADEEWYGHITEISFSAVRISDHFDVYIRAANFFGEGPKISRRFTNPKSDINRTVSGINATATHKLGNTFDIHVTWNMPKLIPDFYIVNVTSNRSETNDRTVHNVSGSATETGFSDVELSEQFTVHVTAWYSVGGGPEVIISFKTPQTPDSQIDVIIPVCLTVTIPAIIIIGIAVYRSSKLRKRKLSQTLPPDEYEINPDRLSITRVLGNGAFGVVKLATLRDNQGNTTTVAVKMLRDDSTENDLRSFQLEIRIMKSLDPHPNIVSFLGCRTIGPYPILVVEYCSRGNLLSFLRRSLEESTMSEPEMKKRVVRRPIWYPIRKKITPKNFSGSCAPRDFLHLGGVDYVRASNVVGYQDENCDSLIVSAMDMLNFGRQIATGMEFLSTNRIIHRDLAARNMLVCYDLIIKISDFGLSRDVYQENVYKKWGNGRLPLKWMAIEALTHEVYSTYSDVWSFGVLLWEIVTMGGTPYPEIPTMEILNQLQSGYRMERPSNCSVPLYNVMLSCWQRRPKDRPTFTALRQELDELISVAAENEYFELNDLSEEILPEVPEASGSRLESVPQQLRLGGDLGSQIISEHQECEMSLANETDTDRCEEDTGPTPALQ